MDLSKKIIKAPKINNYIGLPNITGGQLKENFIDHFKAMNIDITVERINNIYAMGHYFTLIANEKIYEATAVILATGVEYSRSLPGEAEYLGRGVGYCATCDAPLYKGKVVTVIGYNEKSFEEANFISEIVGKVYFIPMYKGECRLRSNIEIIKAVPKEILGTDKVNKIIFQDREISTDAVFILKDNINSDQLVPGLEIYEMHIKVNRKMETNLDFMQQETL